MINAYRVLLTRARQGIVIFVPKGDENDPTRSPYFYNETYDYLVECGFEILDQQKSLLPFCYLNMITNMKMARSTGFEPVTLCLEGRCSIQLS